VTARRQWFGLAALAVVAWVAVIAGVASRSHPTLARRAPRTVAVPPALAAGPPRAGAHGPTTSHRRAAANDSADPAAAAPEADEAPALAALARRWCAAYVGWGIRPRGVAALMLRRLSTPGLFASLAARPPAETRPAATPARAAKVRLFRAPHGATAIVELRGNGADLTLDLSIVATPAGPRVATVYQ
jgi:hypothetical protein